MLRKEEILSRTNNGLLVFKHYLPGGWRIGRHFLNPLYQDKKASCNIYFDRHSGMYKMKDFGNDSYSGDCFFLVGQLKGLDCNRAADFVEILEIIDRDLGLGLASGTPVSIPPATVCRAVPDKPDELKAFCLTGMSRKERLNAIVQSMDKFYYQYGGIQLVVIDGIADLVKSANDEAESVAVIDELYRLAGIYNTCILCVLHFVPNGLKLRGHLGSELQRKAATILSIEKDDEPAQSVVKALKVRDGSPLDVPLMLFAWDKEAGMHVYKGEKPREEKEKRKERELVGVARDIFGRQTHITYIDLCEQLQQVLDVKERTAKSYIRFMREREIIIKDPVNQSYFMIGLI